MADAYTLLGVTRTASELDVRRAYRRLARQLHPDLQPEPLREQSGRRLQAVNAARAQVLADIRRRRPAGPSDGSTVFVPGQRRPTEPAGDPRDPGDRADAADHADAAARWAEHQEWLREQQRDIDAWNEERQAREERRRQVWEQHLAGQRRSKRPGRGGSVLAAAALAALVGGVAWGSAHVVEHVVASATSHEPAVTFVHDSGDLDLREVLALLGAWTS